MSEARVTASQDGAVGIIERMGAKIMTPAQVREKLGLTKRAPA